MIAVRIASAALVIVSVASGACCPGAGSGESTIDRVPPETDPQRGAEVIEEFGCGGCHVIPGIRTATGLDGPPLLWFARRGTIAGAVPNTFDNVVQFLESPDSIHPGSAMPAPGLGRHQAGDVAAYLYTLQ
jgi:cytochrome c